MSIFDTGYYKANRVGLIISGVWPMQSLFATCTIRIVLCALVVSLVIPEHIYMYNIWGDYNALIPCLPSQAVAAISFTKFSFLAFKKNLVQDVIDQVNSDWKLLNNTPAIKVMHLHAQKGRLFTLGYMYYFLISATLFLSCSFIPAILDIAMPLNETREKIPPYETNYGVDSQKYFNWIFLHAVIVSTVKLTWVWTMDVFVIIMVQHCCGLFDSVGVILQQLNKKQQNHSVEYEKEIIDYAIFIHNRAITFADFIELSITNMYAFVVLVNMLLISVTGVETIVRWDKKNEALRMAAFTIGQSVHLFYNTLPGQQLIDDSARVFDAIYDSNWSELSLKSQKLICFMLLRSLKPSYLTAGKFYKLNMENYGQVMKTAMSYLTVLSSMQ